MASHLSLIAFIVLCAYNGGHASSDLFVHVSGLVASMGNSKLNITFNSDASVHSIYKGSKNLLDHIKGGKSGYIDWDAGHGRFKPSHLTLVEHTDKIVHIMYTEGGSTSHLAIELHIIMLPEESSIYHYVKVSNPSSKTITLQEFRTVHRFCVTTMPHASNEVLTETPPTESVLEKSTKVQDATYRLKNGTYYTKYDLASYIHDTPWFGVFGGGYGAWLISPSREYHVGGPLKQDLLVHQDALIANYLTSSHFGTPSLGAAHGWSKFFGPWLLYFNKGSDAEVMADVAKQAKIEQGKWPYSWVNDKEYPLKRGTLTGRVSGQLKAQVVLCSSTNEQFDLQTKGYSFNAKTDANGHFTIKNIRPGSYRLVAYPLAGHGSENQPHKYITINEGTQDAGELKLPEPTGILWSIGETDRKAEGYKLSDKHRNYCWLLEPPANLTFTIGKSKLNTDWYYAQTHTGGVWSVRFTDTHDDHTRTLRIALAAASSGTPHLEVAINGHVVESLTYTNDAAIYRQAMQSGNFHSQVTTIPANYIVTGQNVLSLKAVSGTFMYDAISLAK